MLCSSPLKPILLPPILCRYGTDKKCRPISERGAECFAAKATTGIRPALCLCQIAENALAIDFFRRRLPALLALVGLRQMTRPCKDPRSRLSAFVGVV